MMSVVIVSSPPCEKIDTDTRQFKATFDDLRAHERFSNFTAGWVHRGTLGLVGVGFGIYVEGRLRRSFGILI